MVWDWAHTHTYSVCSVQYSVHATVSDNINFNPCHSHIQSLSLAVYETSKINWIETISVVLPDENLVRNAYVIAYFKSNYQLLCVQPEDGGGDAC